MTRARTLVILGALVAGAGRAWPIAIGTEKVGAVDMQKLFEEIPGMADDRAELMKEYTRRKEELAGNETRIRKLRNEIDAQKRLEWEKIARAMLSPPAPPPPVPVPVTELASATTGLSPAATGLIPATTGLPSGTTAAAFPPGLPGIPPLPTPPPAPPPAPPPLPVPTTGLASLTTGLAPGTTEPSVQEKAGLTLEEKEQALARLEQDTEKLRDKAETEFEEKEAKLTRKYLGRIYEVIREIAQEGEFSVILDRQQLLYGQESEDLTDAVSRKLKRGR